MKLTQSIINRSTPTETDYELQDSKVPELRYRIRRTGQRGWYLYVLLPDGSRAHRKIAAGSVQLEDARGVARDFLGQIAASGKFPENEEKKEKAKQRKDKSLNEILDLYEEQVLTDQPRNTIKNNIKAFGAKILKCKISAITPDVILRWADAAMKSSTVTDPRFLSKDKKMMLKKGEKLPGISPHTCNLRIRELRRMLKWAADRGYCTNPLPKTLKIKEKPTGNINFLSKNEYDKLYAYLTNQQTRSKDYWKTAVVLAVYTGLRLSALFNLRWRDVEWDADKIKIETDKTGNVRRIDLIAPIRDELEVWREIKRTFGGGTDENDRILGPAAIKYNKWHDICVKAIDRKIRWHDLRHTFGTWLLAAGANIKSVQQLMGHRNISTTIKYTHLMSPTAEQAALNQLTDTFSPTPPPTPTPKQKAE